jgi:hypothetical protein
MGDVVGTDVVVLDFDGGTIECGDAEYNANVQYCGHALGGPPPGVDNYACEALPSGCHACTCLNYEANGCQCSSDAGRVFVQCEFP